METRGFTDGRTTANRPYEGVRAVVFDAVGTLITPEPDVVTVYHDIGRAHGSETTLATIGERFGRAFRETGRAGAGSADPHLTSEAAEREFWRAVVSSVFSDVPEPAATACFKALFAHFARPEAWRVFDDVAATLDELNRRGLTLAVASNFDSRLHAVFDGHAELAGITRRFVSSELGWRKPDGRFFHAVCDGLGCRPEQVLYVGDDPEADLAGAEAAGLPALLLRRGATEAEGGLSSLAQLPGRIDPTFDHDVT